MSSDLKANCYGFATGYFPVKGAARLKSLENTHFKVFTILQSCPYRTRVEDSITNLMTGSVLQTIKNVCKRSDFWGLALRFHISVFYVFEIVLY